MTEFVFRRVGLRVQGNAARKARELATAICERKTEPFNLAVEPYLLLNQGAVPWERVQEFQETLQERIKVYDEPLTVTLSTFGCFDEEIHWQAVPTVQLRTLALEIRKLLQAARDGSIMPGYDRYLEPAAPDIGDIYRTSIRQWGNPFVGDDCWHPHVPLVDCHEPTSVLEFLLDEEPDEFDAHVVTLWEVDELGLNPVRLDEFSFSIPLH